MRERKTSFFSGNPYLEISPSIDHQNVESVDLTDIPKNDFSTSKFPPVTFDISPEFFFRIFSRSRFFPSNFIEIPITPLFTVVPPETPLCFNDKIKC